MNPEAWAAAQVEEVAKELEKKAKRERPAKPRGVFFRPRPQGEAIGLKGQRGEWWVLWYDADSRRHREKAGTKAAALALYQRRKTEVRQFRHFPESMRQKQHASLKDLVADYLEAVRASQAKTAVRIARRLAEVVGILGNVEARSIKPEDLERLKIKLTPGQRTTNRKPASVNRYLQGRGGWQASLCLTLRRMLSPIRTRKPGGGSAL